MMDKDHILKYFGYAAMVVIIVWLLSWGIIVLCIAGSTERGQFGDQFGAVNALFSGLAFAGLIITILQQRKDLYYQRKELEQTNQEMARQTKEFDAQNKTLKRQQFENSFFELLRILQTLVNDLQIEIEFIENTRYEKISLHGREVFQELFTKRDKKAIVFPSCYLPSILEIAESEDFDFIAMSKGYSFLYHYFRFVYRILKFVDDARELETDEERYLYVAFLRSTFSNYEIATLFYNGLSCKGKEKFKPLAEKYALFDNIDVRLLASEADLKLYHASAFKFEHAAN